MSSPAKRRLVAAVIGAVLLVCALAALIVREAPAPAVSLISTLVAGNVMTAYLLVGHAIQRRSPTTALLACAYVVTIVVYNVAPPLLGALPPHLPYSADAVSFVAHCGFTLCFAGYALLADRTQAPVTPNRPFGSRIALLLAAAAVGAVVLVATTTTLLVRTPALAPALVGSEVPLAIVVLAFFVIRTRPSISNTWLALALFASALDSLMLALSPPNSLGVFTGQVFGLVSCVLIPAVYLVEFNRQYAWLSRSNATFKRQALTDELTGLGNRRYYDARVEALFKDLGKPQSPLMSILVIDVDHFKKYNDLYGHAEGDACLRAIGRALTTGLLRPADEVMRYGGEEFVVLLPGIDEVGARQVAERLRAAVWNLNLPHEQSTTGRVTVSIGMAIAPRDGISPEQLFAHADDALYEAKRAGRNRSV